MPYGFAKPGYVLKLRKALEGIKQGAHLWMEHNKTVFLDLGFKRSLCEASLYTHTQANILIAVFADDIAAAYATSAAEEYRALKDAYVARIRVRSEAITPLCTFTGVQLHRDREKGTLTISQPDYVDQLAKRYAGKYKLRNTPGPTSTSGRRAFDHLRAGSPTDDDVVDKVEYLKLIGGLIWPASMTTPDIAYFTSFLAQFNSCPLRSHMDAAFDLLGYLVNTRALGMRASRSEVRCASRWG